MSRRCMITGKAILTGNNVSHAKNRTRRRFLPNIQDTSMYSEVLGVNIKLRATSNGIKTVEHNGGIDSWLMSIAPTKLDPKLRPWRAKVAKAIEKKAVKAK